MDKRTPEQLMESTQMHIEQARDKMIGVPRVARAPHGPGTFKLLGDTHKFAFHRACVERGAKFDESIHGFRIDPNDEERLAYKLSNAGFKVDRHRHIDALGCRGPSPGVDRFLSAIEEVCHQHRLTFVVEDGQLKVRGTTRENMAALHDVIDGRGVKP